MTGYLLSVKLFPEWHQEHSCCLRDNSEQILSLYCYSSEGINKGANQPPETLVYILLTSIKRVFLGVNLLAHVSKKHGVLAQVAGT